MPDANQQKMKEALIGLLNGTDRMQEAAEVKFEGERIVLPVGMTEKQAIEILERRDEEMEEEVSIRELIPGFPLDAMLALQRAMKVKYGWTSLEPTPSFWGSKPPTMIGVTTDAQGTVVQVPWSRMAIPGVTGFIQPGIEPTADGRPQLLIGGTVKRRDLGTIAKLMDAARKEAATSSIYRGKAIRVAFPKFDDEHPFDPQIHVPQFLRLNGIQRSDIILRKDTEWAVQTSIFTPIENLPRLRRMGTPFRRGILASGEYGVGKTLLANITAKVCEDNAVTFIYLEKTGDIAQARAFATQYAPAVIFAEDVDAIMAGDERNDEVNAVLNTIDGVEGKHDEVMVIFSTNHPEKINRALLRPGRLDAVITIETPDAEAAERLVRFYARDTLAPSADIREVGRMLEGNIPAAIREVVERAKLAAVPRSSGMDISIGPDDLVFAARSMAYHLQMLKERPQMPLSDIEKLGKVLGFYLRKGIVEGSSGHDPLQASAEGVKTQEDTEKRNGAQASA